VTVRPAGLGPPELRPPELRPPELRPPAAGQGGPTVLAGGTVADAPAAPAGRPVKVIVAVHGIGDQHAYATIQSVVNQFCGYQGHPGGVALGSFHTGRAAFSFSPPYPEEWHGRFAFAEVYWADIPRALSGDRHTLEESRRWARTIVDRLRLRWRGEHRPGDARPSDFRLVDQVLAEMIQTITVLDRLCALADRAGLFAFDLKTLLDNFLGDVQIVAEFRSEREKILRAFADVMDRVHADHPGRDTEIYLVAHSEGTVVALLGLLAACRAPAAPPWLDQLRGFMTLGSPLDKHLVLWPELFGAGPPAHRPRRPVEWRNYYDHGDPVGFALDDTRAWIARHGWDGVFRFSGRPEDGHDIGFARSPFPGKAHVDYWTDPAVFGHFMATVVGEPPPAGAAADYSRPPGDRRWAQVVSYAVPYLLVAALLVAAAFVLFKAVVGAVDPDGRHFASGLEVARRVGGIAALLFGVTVVARVRRLTRRLVWRAAAVATGVLGAAGYLWSVRCVAAPGAPCGPVPEGAGTVAVAALVVAAVYLVGALRPEWKLRPLIALGTAAAAVMVGRQLHAASAQAALGPVWPVFFATAAFFYLWWLAALLFDLGFVWHLYIRHAGLLERMDAITGGARGAPARARR
jgi:hypothetical protein